MCIFFLLLHLYLRIPQFVFCMIADSRRLLCSFTVTMSANHKAHQLRYRTGRQGTFNSLYEEKENQNHKRVQIWSIKLSLTLWKLLQSPDVCLVFCFFLSSHSFWKYPVCVCVCLRLITFEKKQKPKMLHKIAIKETTVAASFVHSPIKQLTVCITLTH